MDYYFRTGRGARKRYIYTTGKSRSFPAGAQKTVYFLFIFQMNFKSYENFNEICQQICGGKIPTFLVTELFHPVATIKYIFFPPGNED